MTGKDPDAYRTISEVASALDLPSHVLRFWETKFPQIKPLKRGGGRRFYRRSDVELLQIIRRRLYDEGYTIRGVQRLLKSKGLSGLTEPDGSSAVAIDAAATIDRPDPWIDAAEMLPARDLVVRLADEIAVCQALLADALQPRLSRAEPDTATPQPPA